MIMTKHDRFFPFLSGSPGAIEARLAFPIDGDFQGSRHHRFGVAIVLGCCGYLSHTVQGNWSDWLSGDLVLLGWLIVPVGLSLWVNHSPPHKYRDRLPILGVSSVVTSMVVIALACLIH